jgi:penicillin-binding protein 1A
MKRYLPLALWFAVVGVMTFAIWYAFASVLGSKWIALPGIPLGKFEIPLPDAPPLAFYPTFVFLTAALLARPPYLWKTGSEYWILGFHWVPKAARRKRSWIDPGRIVFIGFGLRLIMSQDQKWRRRFRLTLASSALISAIGLQAVAAFYLSNVPTDMLAALSLPEPAKTVAYAAGGEELCEYQLEDRVYLSLNDIKPQVRQAFIAAEDKNFYEHGGYDVVSIVRALKENLSKGRTSQGGSTITQQVVKQIVLKDDTRNYSRKIRELFAAARLEQQVSKDRILEAYLNHIFMGRAYGVQAASRAYFGKDVGSLTLSEAAVLAGMPPRPTINAPTHESGEWQGRLRYVLGRMREMDVITEEEERLARLDHLVVIETRNPMNKTAAPYFCAFLYGELKKSHSFEQIFMKGLRIRTTVDMRMQMSAEAAVRDGLLDLERRLGFTGPEGHDAGYRGGCGSNTAAVADYTIEIATVVGSDRDVTVCVDGAAFPMHPQDVKRVRAWEQTSRRFLAAGDILTVRVVTADAGDEKHPRQVRYAVMAKRTGGEGHPKALQASLLSVDPRTGDLKAMVGGFDFNENQFNNAVQSRRQVGSSGKPYVYLTALDKILTVDSIVVDGRACYQTASGTWCPENYKGPKTRQQYMGAVSVRTAVAKSLNSVSVKLAAQVGVDEVIRTMRALGIRSDIPRVLPIAVGAMDLTLWEHTYAYATIAADGRQMPVQCFGRAENRLCREDLGVFVTLVTDVVGKVLSDRPARPNVQAVSASAASAMTYLMKGAIEEGTAKRGQELERVASAKTGTTNDFRDAWLMGYTPDLVTGVWVGRMSPDPIAEEATGGAVALPIWLAYMKTAHSGAPAREFPVPHEVSLRLDPSGKKLLPFPRGRVPERLLTAMPTRSPQP